MPAYHAEDFTHLSVLKADGKYDVMNATCEAYLAAGLRSTPYLAKTTCPKCVHQLFHAVLERMLRLEYERDRN